MPLMAERKRADRRVEERAALIEEVRRLAEDPLDKAEMRTVRADMDALSSEWPYDEDERPPAA
jgi:hypothetical protein